MNANGTIDTTFNVGAGFGDSVGYDFVEQTDGKVVVVGQFSSYSGSSSNNIVRINDNGTRDTTFSIGTGLNGESYSVALEPNGKILAVGAFTTYGGVSSQYSVRIGTSGSRDTTWSPPGTGASIFTVWRQTDGKYLMGGNFTSPGTRTVRVTDSGSTDTTWSCPVNSGVYHIQQTPTGKVIMIGDFTTVSGSSQNKIGRALSSGSFDATLRVGTGFSDSNPFTFGSRVAVVSSPADGMYVASLGPNYSGSRRGGLVKILPSGSIDETFIGGTGEGASLGAGNFIGGNDGGLGVSLSGSGLFVYGRFSSYKPSPINKGAVMLMPSASLSSSFNVGVGFTASLVAPLSTLTYIGSVNSAVRLSDGKYIAVGAFNHYSGSTANCIVRLNTNGTIDTTFNTGTGFNDIALLVRAQSDDKVVVYGNFTTYSGSSVPNGLVRINTNGTRDLTFGGGALTGLVSDMRIQTDNKLVAVGSFTSYSGSNYNRIVRMNSGSVDTTFSIGSGFNFTPECIQIQPDGKILVGGGFVSYNSVTVNRIVRLENSGSRDTTFNTGTGFQAFIPLIRLRPDGSVLAFTQNAGQAYNGFSFSNAILIGNSGSRDTSFNLPTSFLYNGAMENTNHGPDIVQVDSNNCTYIGGKMVSYNGTVAPSLVRLSATGIVDTNYLTGSNAYNGTGAGFDNLVTTFLLL
jgi:uncharacterized delta-60 repeat protein